MLKLTYSLLVTDGADYLTDLHMLTALQKPPTQGQIESFIETLPSGNRHYWKLFKMFIWNCKFQPMKKKVLKNIKKQKTMSELFEGGTPETTSPEGKIIWLRGTFE